MRTKTKRRIGVTAFIGFIVVSFALMFSETYLRIMAKTIGVLLTVFGLAACSTISFTSSQSPPEMEVTQKVNAAPVQKAVQAQGASRPPAMSSIAAMRHGRFIVEVGESLHEIQGGVFAPPTAMLAKSTAAHVLISNYSTKELLYYRRTKSGSYEPMIGYAVVTPKPEELPKAQVRGKVTRINVNPSWCPGPEARKKTPTLPAGCLPPGHKENAMGVAKFEIAWQGVKGFDAIRIHGASGYSLDGAFWNEDTLGCTRLQDSAILALIDLLGQNATKEGIEVILERGDPLQMTAF